MFLLVVAVVSDRLLCVTCHSTASIMTDSSPFFLNKIGICSANRVRRWIKYQYTVNDSGDPDY